MAEGWAAATALGLLHRTPSTCKGAAYALSAELAAWQPPPLLVLPPPAPALPAVHAAAAELFIFRAGQAQASAAFHPQ